MSAINNKQSISVFGKDASFRLRLALPDDREAREWAIDQSKKDDDYWDIGDVPGSSGTLYVYILDNSFLAVGERARTIKGNTTYSW